MEKKIKHLKNLFSKFVGDINVLRSSNHHNKIDNKVDGLHCDLVKFSAKRDRENVCDTELSQNRPKLIQNQSINELACDSIINFADGDNVFDTELSQNRPKLIQNQSINELACDSIMNFADGDNVCDTELSQNRPKLIQNQSINELACDSIINFADGDNVCDTELSQNRPKLIQNQSINELACDSILNFADGDNVCDTELSQNRPKLIQNQSINELACDSILNFADGDNVCDTELSQNRPKLIQNQSINELACDSILNFADGDNVCDTELSQNRPKLIQNQSINELACDSILNFADGDNVCDTELSQNRPKLIQNQSINELACDSIINFADGDNVCDTELSQNRPKLIQNQSINELACDSIINFADGDNVCDTELSQNRPKLIQNQSINELACDSILNFADGDNVCDTELSQNRPKLIQNQSINELACDSILNFADGDNVCDTELSQNRPKLIQNQSINELACDSILNFADGDNVCDTELSQNRPKLIQNQSINELACDSILNFADGDNVCDTELSQNRPKLIQNQSINELACDSILNFADGDNVCDTELSQNRPKLIQNQSINELACDSILNFADGDNVCDTELSQNRPKLIQNQSINELACDSILNFADGDNVCDTELSQNRPKLIQNQSINELACDSILNFADGDNVCDTELSQNRPKLIQNQSINELACDSILNFADGDNVCDTELSQNRPKLIQNQSINELACDSILNFADGDNDFGPHEYRSADFNEGISHINFNKIAFISEAEVATLEGFEVLMDLDLELETPLHMFDKSNIDLPANQLPSSAVQKVQTNLNSNSLYENFIFGYDDAGTHDNEILDNTESLPIPSLSLLMNVNPGQRSCDNSEMVISTSDRSKQEKHLFCSFCKKTVSKLARHLTNVHKKEIEVKRLNCLPKGSKQRLKGLAKLRKRGTFEHNNNRNYNKGVLLTSRRPNIKHHRDASGYTTCVKCLGSYSKTSIRNHFKTCDEVDIDLNGERSILVLGRMVEGRVHEDACDTLKDKVLSHMTEDDIVRLIRFDWLIIAYGNKLCDAHVEIFQYDVISGKLRLAGRLLSKLKSIEPDVTDFASLYRLKFYDSVIRAIRTVGRFDPVTNYYGSATTSKAAVTLIRAVGAMLVAEYIKKEDGEGQTRTENFNKVFDSSFGTSINKGVYRTLAKMKRDKREKLPSTEDIKLLATYIERQRKASFLELSKKFSYEAWLNLARMTMSSLIVFNRRRTGETQNILTTDFDRREYLEKEWIDTLPVEDQKLAKQYSRMKIRGKLGRTVPCLVKPAVDKSIQLLIRHRKNAKVADDNEFLFALPTISKTKNRRINACNVLRKLSVLCGAKDPQTLRATKMRKHVASMCISMELSESSVLEVADFMGHHEKVHYKYYRKMPIVREIVKMSKLLQTAQGMDDEEGDEISEDEYQEDPEGDLENWPDQDDGVGRDEASEEKINDGVSRLEAAGRIEASKEKKKITKTRWSPKEVAAAQKLFSSDLSNKKLPSLAAIDERRNETLKNRTSRQIKTWMYNQIKKTFNQSIKKRK